MYQSCATSAVLVSASVARKHFTNRNNTEERRDNMHLYSEELVASRAKIRFDGISRQKNVQLVGDTTFLNYRLAGVEVQTTVTKNVPDIIWFKDEKTKSVYLAGEQVILTGDWYEGEIQKVLVSLMAKRMLEEDLFLFHASAVRYRNKSILFLGGESNSGKTMCQIEACRRGGSIISTETLVTEKDGSVVMGSKNVFLRLRTKGTERVDKPNQDEGVAKFFAQTPEFEAFTGETNIDFVIVPDIDGNYETQGAVMSAFEKQYQTFHCLCDYLGHHLLLAPGLSMPVFDNNQLRAKRTAFIEDFTSRPYHFIRAKNPQVILDQVDGIIEGQ
jgi:hypothetical protein